MESSPVLVVGGTGYLGSQVVTALLDRGRQVRALVRPGSDAARLEAAGVEIARGDMMDSASLARAMGGVDAVVTTAAGYTGHSQGDTSEIDVVGNRNLADSAAQVGVRRFVFTSILTCDQTPQVPHFWHKKLAEDRLEDKHVAFVALRPGALLDQVARFGGDPFAQGSLSWPGAARVPLTFVLSTDLATYLAAAVDADIAAGERIDIGWECPVSIQDVADISSRLLGRQIKVGPRPIGMSGTAEAPGGVAPAPKDMAAMLEWFETGRYVADTTRQGEVFGTPTAEDAIGRFITSLGHPIASADQPD
ncbi:SDR family oxidoreductase [Arthrobacter sp. I2-34]|uniref:SDR family oxidoreductase n=1 Tax=Arthrobacter hankyongi TaxID=2904801 RepID=A0ABS9LBS2_9MICC|nr:SDR family oxidoreductase [Arthrobacter hankyongi]MCG2624122.1 SDR family oxidoreductase [Arthrobacter hankyongi]